LRCPSCCNELALCLTGGELNDVKDGARTENGLHIELQKDDTLVIRLPENPSTGYRWAVQQNGTIMRLESAHFDLTEGAGIGGGGLRTLCFKAASLGAVKLQVVLRREWQKGAPAADVYEVQIRVAN
jgi:inhibitor of cysteine peptidase